MRLLLDSHTLLWWFSNNPALSRKAHRAIVTAGNEVAVSAASAWELAIKSKSGKLKAAELLSRFPADLEEAGFQVLPITLDHALRAGALVEHHRDPFDRMLVAQAQAEHLPVVSNDPIFERYGVRCIW